MIDLDKIAFEYEKALQKPDILSEPLFDFGMAKTFEVDAKKLFTADFLEVHNHESLKALLGALEKELRSLLAAREPERAEKEIAFFFSKIPETRSLLLGSIKAIFDGDPASDSYAEIVLCYPGFSAILSYRIAHLLYLMDEKLIARFIAESAHQKTGIDINPGAEIGENFFIDHGTGIVIGETSLIGNNVKIYQGVTLGALSLSKGKLLKGQKRHPTVEDNVTIYSSAAIFGGETVIGHDSTIGSVTYLTKSVPPYSLVYLGDTGIVISEKKRQKQI